MKNIKLGDQIYEGVQTVRLDTAAGGTVDFAPYQETFAAGRVEGYNAGKEAGLEEGFDKGVKSEYDRFWDAYQEKGAVIVYRNHFSYEGWSDITFYPKYDIVVCNELYAGDGVFRYCLVTNVAQRLEEQGVKLDTSQCVWVENICRESISKRWPHMDFSSATTANYAFFWAQCHTIDLVTANENCTWVGAFGTANQLVNITFDGTIGKSIDFSASPLSVDSMKSVIAHLKNYIGSDSALANRVKFTDACWAALEADGSAPDGNTWRDYVETTLGWLT